MPGKCSRGPSGTRAQGLFTASLIGHQPLGTALNAGALSCNFPRSGAFSGAGPVEAIGGLCTAFGLPENDLWFDSVKRPDSLPWLPGPHACDHWGHEAEKSPARLPSGWHLEGGLGRQDGGRADPCPGRHVGAKARDCVGRVPCGTCGKVTGSLLSLKIGGGRSCFRAGDAVGDLLGSSDASPMTLSLFLNDT